MKKIEVTIKAEFEIPDDWEVIKNHTFAEGEDYTVHVVKTNEEIITFDVDFLKAYQDKNGFHSCEDDISNDLLDRMIDSTCVINEIK